MRTKTSPQGEASASRSTSPFGSGPGSLREKVFDLALPSWLRPGWSVSTGATITEGAERLTESLVRILDTETPGFLFEHARLGYLMRHDIVGHQISIGLKTIALVPSLKNPAPQSHQSTILLRAEDRDKALEIVSHLAQQLDCKLVWGSGAATHFTNTLNQQYPTRAIHYLTQENCFDTVTADSKQFVTFSFMLFPPDGQQAVYSRTNARRVAESWERICSTPEKIAVIQKASNELNALGTAAVHEYNTALETKRHRDAAEAETKAALVRKAVAALWAVREFSSGPNIPPAWCETFLGQGGIEITLGALVLSSTYRTRHADDPSDQVCYRIAGDLEATLAEGLSTSDKPQVRVFPAYSDLDSFLSSYEDLPLRNAHSLSARIMLPYQMLIDLPSDQLVALVKRIREFLEIPIEDGSHQGSS